MFFPFWFRYHAIGFTRAQSIPKYKIMLERGKDGRVGEGLVEEGGGEGGVRWPSLVVVLAVGGG
jgi:hypothetical protein